MKRKYRILTTTLIIAICLLISIYSLFTYKKIGEIYRDETRTAIINIKKSFLKNTVDNLIFEIESDRKNLAEMYKKYIVRRYDTLTMENHLSDNEFVDYFINRFSLDINVDSYLDYWTVFLWNNSSNQTLYDPGNIVGNDVNSQLDELKQAMSYYKIINHGEISGFIGVSQNFIDNSIKTITADRIRKLKFDNGSYIWVNEVLDYNGGKDYAIRIVHPNLPETEGMYLSTDMMDSKGNLPYLEELEGIKKHGELFIKYYFKELKSDAISEKLSFLKLYKDFDWVIGMGVHMNDIQEYVFLTNEKSIEVTRQYISIFLFFLVVIIFISLVSLLFLKNWYFKKEKNEIEKANNIDMLTPAFTRKYGTNELNKALAEFKKNGTNPAIMMFDIDNFKYINDTFGHDVGDHTLKEVITTIYKNIRNTDKLVRWGGDEFVGICYGLNRENVLAFGEKLRSSVQSMKILSGETQINATISIGFSYFNESDENISDVIKRVDMAMYKSKEEGRNTVNLLV